MKVANKQIFEIVGLSAVVLSVLFLAYEIRQNSEQQELDLIFQVTQKLVENNRDMLNDDLSLVYAKAITAPEELSFDEYLKAGSFVLNLLNEWEDRFFIHEAGLISDRQWKRHIEETAPWTLGNKFAREYWDLNKYTYEEEFVQFVDSLLPTIRGNIAYEEWLNFRLKVTSEN